VLINPEQIVSISEANQNFSKVAKMVDEKKQVVIMKNNKPKYVMMDFEEYRKLENNKEITSL
jgi:antitoxin Phd